MVFESLGLRALLLYNKEALLCEKSMEYMHLGFGCYRSAFSSVAVWFETLWATTVYNRFGIYGAKLPRRLDSIRNKG